jgi:hypothetical protein
MAIRLPNRVTTLRVPDRRSKVKGEIFHPDGTDAADRGYANASGVRLWQQCRGLTAGEHPLPPNLLTIKLYDAFIFLGKSGVALMISATCLAVNISLVSTVMEPMFNLCGSALLLITASKKIFFLIIWEAILAGLMLKNNYF